MRRHFRNLHNYEFCMNCDWVFTEEQSDAKPGWRFVKCTRRGCWIKGGPTPHELDNIQSSGCEGWPRWWEWGGIIELALGVIGVNQRSFNALRRMCGFTTPCKCPGRAAVLNASGGWLRDRLDVLKVAWRYLWRHR